MENQDNFSRPTADLFSTAAERAAQGWSKFPARGAATSSTSGLVSGQTRTNDNNAADVQTQLSQQHGQGLPSLLSEALAGGTTGLAEPGRGQVGMGGGGVANQLSKSEEELLQQKVFAARMMGAPVTVANNIVDTFRVEEGGISTSHHLEQLQPKPPQQQSLLPAQQAQARLIAAALFNTIKPALSFAASEATQTVSPTQQQQQQQKNQQQFQQTQQEQQQQQQQPLQVLQRLLKPLEQKQQQYPTQPQEQLKLQQQRQQQQQQPSLTSLHDLSGQAKPQKWSNRTQSIRTNVNNNTTERLGKPTSISSALQAKTVPEVPTVTLQKQQFPKATPEIPTVILQRQQVPPVRSTTANYSGPKAPSIGSGPTTVTYPTLHVGAGVGPLRPRGLTESPKQDVVPGLKLLGTAKPSFSVGAQSTTQTFEVLQSLKDDGYIDSPNRSTITKSVKSEAKTGKMDYNSTVWPSTSEGNWKSPQPVPKPQNVGGMVSLTKSSKSANSDLQRGKITMSQQSSHFSGGFLKGTNKPTDGMFGTTWQASVDAFLQSTQHGAGGELKGSADSGRKRPLTTQAVPKPGPAITTGLFASAAATEIPFVSEVEADETISSIDRRVEMLKRQKERILQDQMEEFCREISVFDDGDGDSEPAVKQRKTTTSQKGHMSHEKDKGGTRPKEREKSRERPDEKRDDRDRQSDKGRGRGDDRERCTTRSPPRKRLSREREEKRSRSQSHHREVDKKREGHKSPTSPKQARSSSLEKIKKDLGSSKESPKDIERRQGRYPSHIASTSSAARRTSQSPERKRQKLEQKESDETFSEGRWQRSASKMSSDNTKEDNQMAGSKVKKDAETKTTASDKKKGQDSRLNEKKGDTSSKTTTKECEGNGTPSKSTESKVKGKTDTASKTAEKKEKEKSNGSPKTTEKKERGKNGAPLKMTEGKEKRTDTLSKTVETTEKKNATPSMMTHKKEEGKTETPSKATGKRGKDKDSSSRTTERTDKEENSTPSKSHKTSRDDAKGKDGEKSAKSQQSKKDSKATKSSPTSGSDATSSKIPSSSHSVDSTDTHPSTTSQTTNDGGSPSTHPSAVSTCSTASANLSSAAPTPGSSGKSVDQPTSETGTGGDNTKKKKQEKVKMVTEEEAKVAAAMKDTPFAREIKNSSIPHQMELLRKLDIEQHVADKMMVDWFCYICGSICHTCKVYLTHIDGPKHRNLYGRLLEPRSASLKKDLISKLELLPKKGSEQHKKFEGIRPRCTVCNLMFQKIKQYRMHLVSPAHKKKVQAQVKAADGSGDTNQASAEDNTEAEKKTPSPKANIIGLEFITPISGYFCKLCSKFYNNEKTAREVHCATPLHITKARQYYATRNQSSGTSLTASQATATEDKTSTAASTPEGGTPSASMPSAGGDGASGQDAPAENLPADTTHPGRASAAEESSARSPGKPRSLASTKMHPRDFKTSVSASETVAEAGTPMEATSTEVFAEEAEGRAEQPGEIIPRDTVPTIATPAKAKLAMRIAIPQKPTPEKVMPEEAKHRKAMHPEMMLEEPDTSKAIPIVATPEEATQEQSLTNDSKSKDTESKKFTPKQEPSRKATPGGRILPDATPEVTKSRGTEIKADFPKVAKEVAARRASPMRTRSRKGISEDDVLEDSTASIAVKSPSAYDVKTTVAEMKNTTDVKRKGKKSTETLAKAEETESTKTSFEEHSSRSATFEDAISWETEPKVSLKEVTPTYLTPTRTKPMDAKPLGDEQHKSKEATPKKSTSIETSRKATTPKQASQELTTPMETTPKRATFKGDTPNEAVLKSTPRSVTAREIAPQKATPKESSPNDVPPKETESVGAKLKEDTSSNSAVGKAPPTQRSIPKGTTPQETTPKPTSPKISTPKKDTRKVATPEKQPPKEAAPEAVEMKQQPPSVPIPTRISSIRKAASDVPSNPVPFTSNPTNPVGAQSQTSSITVIASPAGQRRATRSIRAQSQTTSSRIVIESKGGLQEKSSLKSPPEKSMPTVGYSKSLTQQSASIETKVSGQVNPSDKAAAIVNTLTAKKAQVTEKIADNKAGIPVKVSAAESHKDVSLKEVTGKDAAPNPKRGSDVVEEINVQKSDPVTLTQKGQSVSLPQSTAKLAKSEIPKSSAPSKIQDSRHVVLTRKENRILDSLEPVKVVSSCELLTSPRNDSQKISPVPRSSSGLDVTVDEAGEEEYIDVDEIMGDDVIVLDEDSGQEMGSSYDEDDDDGLFIDTVGEISGDVSGDEDLEGDWIIEDVDMDEEDEDEEEADFEVSDFGEMFAIDEVGGSDEDDDDDETEGIEGHNVHEVEEWEVLSEAEED